MSDAELLSRWTLILVIAAVVVLIAAGLLITVLVLARRIEAAADRCLVAVQKIAQNTAPIWELEKTSTAAWEIRELAGSIRRHVEEIAEALQAPAGPRA